jgi:hypothetical protein
LLVGTSTQHPHHVRHPQSRPAPWAAISQRLHERRAALRNWSENIELLLDLEWRSNLLLGAELSRMKWSGDYTRDTVWQDRHKASGMGIEWLKRREFRSGAKDVQ